MPDAPAPGGKAAALMPTLQTLQLAVTVVLAVMGFFLQQRAAEQQRRLDELKAELAARQEDRADRSARDTLRINLFEKVSASLVAKDDRQQRIAKSLVLSMLPEGDELRLGLTAVLALEGVPGVKEAAQSVVQAEQSFAADQSNVAALAVQAAGGGADETPPGDLKGYLIDVFHCDAAGAPAAREVRERLQRSGAVRDARVRALPESLNASPGYGIAGRQIRHNADEAAASQALQALLQKWDGGQAYARRLVKSPTPRYMSVFTC